MKHGSNEPFVLTPIALTRILQSFAAELGMKAWAGGVLAQVFVQKTDMASRWDAWLRSQCSGCPHALDTCGFFNPAVRPEGVSEAEARASRMMLLETGRTEICAYKGPSNPG